MGQNLTGQLISATYESLVQISGSIITDGTGSDITSLDITASNALSANSASVATSASFADTSISSSYALTASFALNATVDSGSFMITGSVSSNTLTFEKGDGSTFSLTVDTGSAVTVDTGSLMVTGSVTNNTLTFTKGDGSTFNLTVDTGSAVTTNTGSLLVTASISDATITFTKGDASTFDITVNNVQNASTASLAVNATNAVSASHAVNADTSISASYALTASYVEGGGSIPNLQQVTTAGAITSESIQLTDGTTANATMLGTGNAITLNSIDGTTPMAFDFADASAMNYGGMTFDPSVSQVSIYANGGLVKLENNTQVTGSLEVSAGITGSLNGNADTATSASYALTASYALNAGGTAFPYTGSARITGSLIITGSQNMLSTNPLTGNRIVDIQLGNNTTTNVPQRFVVRSYNPNNRTTSVSNAIMVWGGDGNYTLTGFNTVALGIGTVNSNANNAAILGSDLFTSTIGDTNTALIAATYNCTAVGLQRSAIIATQGSYGQGFNTAVIGGRNHWMYDLDGSNQVDRTVILGGTGITASLNDAVYVPTLVVSGSLQGYKTLPVNISASVINISGSTNVSGSFKVNGVAPLIGVPSWQEVTVAGAITDQNLTINNDAAATELVITSDASNTYNSSIRLGGGSGYGGSAFNIAMLPGDIASLQSDGNLIDIASNTQVTGSLRGNVSDLSISSNTASLDLATGNFFTLQLVGGTDTYIEPTNILPGQTINLRVNTTGSATVSFPTSVLQPSGSAYVPTTTTGVDLLTFVSFDNTVVYLSGVKNLV